MQRFIKEVIVFAIFLIGFLSVSAFFVPSYYIRKTMLAEQVRKVARLEELPGRRIVFVGGSNLSQGLDSILIEKKCGVKVVNMGLHAGLGVRYNLKVAENYVHAGDIVVLCLEYNTCNQGGYGDGILLAMVCDIMPDHKRLLDACDWLHLFRYIPSYGAKKYQHILKQYTYSGVNCSLEYNEQGDHRPELRPKPNKLLITQSAMDQTFFSGRVVPFIGDFKKFCENKGCTVIVMPPVLMESSYRVRKKFINAVAEGFRKAGFPYIVDPEEFVLPDNLFYNSADHLNVHGVPIRTQRVINSLLPIVNESTN